MVPKRVVGASAEFPVRVEREDPVVFSCAACGWQPGYTGTPAPLLWAVIRHWLEVHWEWGPQRAPLPERDR